MTVFVLAHSAYSGAWEFDFLRKELEERGEAGIAADLPIDDPDAGLDDYVDILVEAAAGCDDVVAVGHSMGGLVAPSVAERTGARKMIFVASPIPLPGQSLADRRAAEPEMMLPTLAGHIRDNEDGTRSVDPAAAMDAMFHDCPPEISQWAVSRLRPQSGRSGSDPVRFSALPPCPAEYVLCRQDRMVSPEWARARVPELIGATPIEIDGGHFPMLSRPAALAEILCNLAT